MAAWTGIISENVAKESAAPLLQQVLEANPDNYQARALMLHTELGIEGKFTPQERNRMFQELRDLLPLFPDTSFLRYIVALHLSFTRMLYQDSIEVLQAGLLVDPLSANLHATLGKTFMRMERYEEAMESLQHARELQPDDPNVYFDIGDLKAEQGDLNGSLEWRLKATKIDPRDHELAAEMAQILFELGLFEEGNRWAAKSIALAPQSAVGRRIAMQQAYYRRDFDQALAHAKSMIQDQVSIRQGSLFTALNIFTELMSKNARQQEAYEAICAHSRGLP